MSGTTSQQTGGLGAEFAGAEDGLERRAWAQLGVAEAKLFGAPSQPGRTMLEGRYSLIERVGGGGQGAVWLAHDEELDRRVAVKFAHRRPGFTWDAIRSVRAEAQALGRFAHPNVVQVFAVGGREDVTYIVMEHVAGATLDAWLAQRPRSVGSILRVFRQIGDGLQAAHDAGLVHRDVKPANILVGDDGRVRLADFGLADEPWGIDEATTDGTDVDASVARGGAVVGTPLYMAPEQLEGFGASALSDQFALATTLFEALFDVRPHEGRDAAGLRDAKRLGPPPSPSGRLTQEAYAALARGLAPEPAERHGSVDAFLHAVIRRPSLRLRLGGGVVVTFLGAAAVMLGVDSQQCEAQDHLDGVWDEWRRAEIAATFAASEVPMASTTWTQVETGLDEFAAAWVAQRNLACEAVQVGEHTPEQLDIRVSCYDGALQDMRALVDVLADADGTVIAGSVAAVMSLPNLESCGETLALTAESPPRPDPHVAADVRRVGDQIAVSEALLRTGRYDASMRRATAALRHATRTGYEPAIARAELQLGLAAFRAVSYSVAESSLQRAYYLSTELRMAPEAAVASAELTMLIGYELGRFDDGERWLRRAQAQSAAGGGDEAFTQAITAAGNLALARGDYELAHDRFRRAVARLEGDVEVDDHEYARALLGLANAEASVGDVTQAQEHGEQALAILESIFGAGHPDLAAAHSNLGVVAGSSGDLAGARRHFEDALYLVEESLGPDYPRTAVVLANLGTVARLERDYAGARDYFQRAIAIWERNATRSRPDVAEALSSLGSVAAQEGDTAQAETLHQRGLAMLIETLGADHPLTGRCHYRLGQLAMSTGDDERAAARFLEKVRISENAMGPDHRDAASALNNLGILAKRSGDLDEAREYHQRVLRIRQDDAEQRPDLVATPLNNLGEVAFAEGDFATAAAHFREALEIRDAVGMPEHRVAFPLTGLGRALVALGRADEAVPLLRRAVAARTKHAANPEHLELSRAALAKALRES